MAGFPLPCLMTPDGSVSLNKLTQKKTSCLLFAPAIAHLSKRQKLEPFRKQATGLILMLHGYV